MTVSATALERSAPDGPTQSVEVTRIHTRLLKCPLALDACRAYWAHVPADRPASVDEAFRAGWFGVKSEAWVEVLLSNMRARFDAHADVLWVLRHWRHMGADTRAVIGHVHLAIVDPLYRRFTGEYLPELRRFGQAVTRHGLLRFLEEHGAEHWTLATRLQFASRLCSSAEEAGLLRGKREPRELLYPRVPDDALGYMLQLLRGLSFSGTLLDNAYLASLSLTRADVLARAPRLDALTLLASGPSIVCEWRHPSMRAWATATVLEGPSA